MENRSSPPVPAPSAQYLAFTLADAHYAVELLRVSEILEFIPPTRVPSTPAFIRGVINLRGTVVPIIDLHIKLGLPAVPETNRACIAILEVAAGWGETVRLGVIADTVNDIVDFGVEDIESPPPFGTQIRIEFLRGVGKKGDRLYFVLELDRVLSPEELSAVDAANAEGDSEALGAT